MIELMRCGAQDNDRYLPAVTTQGGASTYETMIDNSTMQTRSQQMIGRGFGSASGAGRAAGGQTAAGVTSGSPSAAPDSSGGMTPSAAQGSQMQGMAPSAAQGSQMQGMTPGTVRRIDTNLGPLPGGPDGMSASEQILHSSWKSLMARNVGRSVIVSFLIGTQNTIVTHGILYEVGNDYIALYQPDEESYISADLYSIRFVEFLPEVTQTNSQQQRQ